MMKTRHRSDRTGARAKRAAASSLLALSALGVGGGSALAAGGSGSIWTTDEPCSAPAAQNQNAYAAGDTVYVRGENFARSTSFDWEISGKPGGASGDPGVVVASGPGSTDPDGAFCLGTYVVVADDWGVYSVDVTQGRTGKSDNYHVDGTGEPADPPADEPADPPADEPADEPADPPADEPADPPADLIDQTTDPAAPQADEPANPAAVPADPPADEPADEPTDTVDQTTSPADPPADEPAAPVADVIADQSSTDRPAAPTTSGTPTTAAIDADEVTPLAQLVLGEVSTGSGIELPATDTVADVVTGGSSILLILGLAGLAGAAVLFAPIRRRDPEATE